MIGRALAIAALVALTACGGSGGSGGGVASAGEARGSAARAAGDDRAAQAGAASVNGFGLALLHDTLGLSKGNVAVSPWSIATALGMARLGAKGETASQLDSALHAGADFPSAMNSLDQALASRNGEFPFGPDKRHVEVDAANRAFAQRGLAFERPFLDDLSRYYGSSVGLVDYQNGGHREDARRSINGWVSARTKDRIPELLKRDVLSNLTRLVLVNAVYLKADWNAPFEKEATKPDTFHAPGRDVTVPFMHDSSTRRFLAGDGFKAVELDYAGEKLAMTFVVPGAGRYDDVIGRLDAAVGALDRLQNVEVDLALPKFDIDKALSLKDELAALGMPLAFDDAADFSGMTRQEPLHISDVVHQANVTVDEKGTVAAAATGVVMSTVSAPLYVEHLTVDRPFVFLLRDRPTGAILFAGQVTDPSQKRA